MSKRKLSFKWFGSLTNLSFRRSTEKSDSKTSPSKSGAGCVPGDGKAILAPVVETTMDDMDAMRPRTASYIRSSESYTHMGTLPRLLMKRRDKSNKGGPSSNKKSKDKSSISRSQSQRPLRDQDCGGSKAARDEAGSKADTGLGKDSLTVPKTQPEPIGETNVTNTQNTISTMSPSGGPSAALQPETCDKQSITQAGADLNPEETSSPPPSRGNDQINEDEGLESRPVSEPKEEAERQLTGGADKGNQNSDSIYW